MARIRNPRRFSDHYGIAASELARCGALDPTLNADTRLFIDPLLLGQSRHPEMASGARRAYEEHFGRIIRFLRASEDVSDVAWRSAKRMLRFPEVKWTCLGYGARSVSGSGSGHQMTEKYLNTAAQIIRLGIDDPDLFVAMALFEDGVGPDRISDMTTNVVLRDLLEFNDRILPALGVSRKPHTFTLLDGSEVTVDLAENPLLGPGEPVILVPSDVLRALPVATDWSEVQDAAARNAKIRMVVNRQISGIWESISKRDKRQLRRSALATKEGFELFLEIVQSVTPRHYDLISDPEGEVFWLDVSERIAREEPWELQTPATWSGTSVAGVVEKIIGRFKFLVEERRLSELLYCDGRPRRERSAQRLFFAVADAYCQANDLDLTPEADTGNGPVDFKVSRGFSGKTLVEIKLSVNKKLVRGYTKQMEAYRIAEETASGFYVVIDVGGLGGKYEQLLSTRNRTVLRGGACSRIVLVDGKRRLSASKR
ncbi:MAG: hypothetical protein OXF79_01905 [Chloroflexi bacterium]|nr:hypothetical protein [Chloroflexota bacterium]